ncbi:MAG: site-2 protease family protein [Fluviicola sp.]|nr:site-2 protease family protein [Fluviicola sp.]
MEDNINSFYPPKPFLEKEEKQKGHLAVTVFSLMLFALSFVLFFGEDFRFLIEIIGVLIVHELGHFLMMKRFKYENVRMLFVPFMGAFVHGSKEKYRQRQSLLVVLAGPLPGIMFGTAAWLVGMHYEISWMIEVALIAFFLNVINLIPLQPLDGGRILNILFFEKIELFQVVFAFTSSLALIGLGFYLDLYIMMVIGFLMGFQVRSMHRRYLIHKSLKEQEVGFQSTYDDLSDKAYHEIKNEVMEHTPGLRKFRDVADEEDFSKLVASEVKNILLPPMLLDLGIVSKIIALIIWISALAGPVIIMWNYNILSLFNAV